MDDFCAKVSRIFEIIEESTSVLIPLHLNPDGDSVASALAFGHVLKKLGNEIVISSTDPVPDFDFLPGFESIQHKDLADFDFNKFDLLLLLDSSRAPKGVLPRHTREDLAIPPDLSVVLIDHHPHSQKYPKFKEVIIREEAASTTEILYRVFEEREISIGKDVSTALMTGLVSDNGFFRFPNTTASSFGVASRLLEKGVDYSSVIFHLLRQVPKAYLPLWSLILGNITVDDEYKFLLSTVSYGELQDLGLPFSLVSPARKGALSMFFQQIKGTEFGVLLTEEEPGLVRGSLRSRTGFDVSKIASALGGGGHRLAAGFDLEVGLDDAKKKVLKTAREIVNQAKINNSE